MLKQIQAKMQDRKGFTLIELMIVIAILGVLAAVAIPYYNQYITNSKSRIAKTNYEAAVRTVKNEFSNVTAGNVPSTNIIATLNDDDGTGAKNKNPFNPQEAAFVTGGAPNKGQVDVSLSAFTGIATGDTVDISVDAGDTNLSQTLTFQ